MRGLRRCGCCDGRCTLVYATVSTRQCGSLTTATTGNSTSSKATPAVRTTRGHDNVISNNNNDDRRDDAAPPPLPPRRHTHTGSERGVWRFLGFGMQRAMPLHPLHQLQHVTQSRQASAVQKATVTRPEARHDDAATRRSSSSSTAAEVLSPTQMRLTRRILQAAKRIQARRGMRAANSNSRDDDRHSSSNSSGDTYNYGSAYDRQAKHRQRGTPSKPELKIDLTEEQRLAIIARYVETKWYAPLYRPFRHITDTRVKKLKRRTRLLLVVGYVVMYTAIMYVYYDEMRTVQLLSERDRRDYVYMVSHMRYSDIVREGRRVLDRVDPHNALPAPARYHLVIDACRARGWHRVDWQTELRTMHPRSAIEDLDWRHLLYWLIVYVGKTTATSGAYFSDRYANLSCVYDNAVTAEREGQFVPAEPVAPPASSAAST